MPVFRSNDTPIIKFPSIFSNGIELHIKIQQKSPYFQWLSPPFYASLHTIKIRKKEDILLKIRKNNTKKKSKMKNQKKISK